MLTYFGKGRQGSGDKGFAVLQEVRAYWQALRVGDALPRRDQIDPRGIAGALENVFLLERIAVGHARFRVAGMLFSDLMGMEVRGMPLSALFDTSARSRLSEGLEQVFTGPAGLEMWLEAERGLGRPTLTARMLVLPLIGSQGEPSLALGCVATNGTLGRAPRRFHVTAMVREPLAVAAMPGPRLVLAESLPKPVPQIMHTKPQLRLVSSR